MKKQITFYGSNSDSFALEWLNNLSRCFTIKKALIKKIEISRKYGPKELRFRVNVEFENLI